MKSRIEKWILWTVSLAVLVLSLSTVNAQSDSLKTRKDFKKTPVAELLLKSTNDKARISGLGAEMLSKEEIAAIKSRVKSRMDQLKAFYATDKKTVLIKTNYREMENRKRQWISQNATIEVDISYLSNVLASLESNSNKLISIADYWRNFMDVYPKIKLNRVLRNKVQSILDTDKKFSAPYLRQINLVLAELDVLANEKVRLEATINELNDATGLHQNRLFVTDHYNLFEHLNKLGQEPGFFDLTNKAFQDAKVELQGFSEKFSHEITAQIITVIIILFFTFIVKRNLKRYPSQDEPMVEYANILFRWPILLSLLVSLIFASIYFKNAPALFGDVLSLIIIAPFLIVVPKMMYPSFRPYVYYVSIFWFMMELSEMVSSYSIYGRGLMLIVQVLGIMLLVKMMLKDKLYLEFKKEYMQIGFKLIHGFCTLVLGLAFLGNIFGSIGFSDLFTSSVIKAIIFSIFIFTWILVLKSMFYVVMRSDFLKSRKLFKKFEQEIKDFMIKLISVYGALHWSYTMMRAFNVQDQVIEGVEGIFFYEMSIGNFNVSLWNISAFLFILWFSSLISKIIRVVLEDEVLNRFTMARGLPGTISMLVRYSIVTVGFFIAISAAGFEMSQLSILFGAFGVGIGFGLQNIFNNLVSGLILAFERPIQLGDTVEVGDLIGTVKNIGIRSSNVHTLDGAEVIVPNGNLISNEVINWTLSDKKRRITVMVGVAYGSEVHTVKDLLIKVMEEHEEIINYPRPAVYFHEFGESSLDFRMLFWTKDFNDWLRIKSEVIFSVHDALYDNNIEIPFPQRDLHVRSVDGKVVQSLESGKKE